jgi:hypothetical protein
VTEGEVASNAWVSFRADFPDDPDPEESRCKALGEYLIAALPRAGVPVLAADSWRDAGWSIDCRIDDRVLYVIVTYPGAPDIDYVLCCTSNVGFFDWLRGRNDASARWTLARIMHQILTNDPRFADIRWYPTGWYARGDEAWTSSPSEVS